MTSNRFLVWAAYLLGALFVIVPLFDATTSFWPPHLGDERWRFTAIGSLSNVLLVPLLGLLILLVVATLMEHRRVQRAIGTFCIVAALLLAVLDILFILDFFQVRTQIQPRFQHATTVASTTAFFKHVLSIVALILLGRAGFAGPKPVTRRQTIISTPEPSPLIPVGNAPRAG